MIEHSADYMLNLATGEVKQVVPTIAAKLASYGWRRVGPAEYRHYQQTLADYYARKYASALPFTLH